MSRRKDIVIVAGLTTLEPIHKGKWESGAKATDILVFPTVAHFKLNGRALVAVQMTDAHTKKSVWRVKMPDMTMSPVMFPDAQRAIKWSETYHPFSRAALLAAPDPNQNKDTDDKSAERVPTMQIAAPHTAPAADVGDRRIGTDPGWTGIDRRQSPTDVPKNATVWAKIRKSDGYESKPNPNPETLPSANVWRRQNY